MNFNKDNILLLCACGPQIMKNIDLEHPLVDIILCHQGAQADESLV